MLDGDHIFKLPKYLNIHFKHNFLYSLLISVVYENEFSQNSIYSKDIDFVLQSDGYIQFIAYIFFGGGGTTYFPVIIDR